MTSDEWRLDPEHEAQYLTPWLDAEPDPLVRELVTHYLAEVVAEPVRPNLEDHDERTGEALGVYSTQVPGTSIGIIWLLDSDKRLVVLAGVGPV